MDRRAMQPVRAARSRSAGAACGDNHNCGRIMDDRLALGVKGDPVVDCDGHPDWHRRKCARTAAVAPRLVDDSDRRMAGPLRSRSRNDWLAGSACCRNVGRPERAVLAPVCVAATAFYPRDRGLAGTHGGAGRTLRCGLGSSRGHFHTDRSGTGLEASAQGGQPINMCRSSSVSPNVLAS